MERLEKVETWKDFLNKNVKVIYDDKGRDFPLTKEGLCKEVNETHFIILRNDNFKTEAIRLIDIRRVELRGEGKNGK